jgi:hypothetical protein
VGHRYLRFGLSSMNDQLDPVCCGVGESVDESLRALAQRRCFRSQGVPKAFSRQTPRVVVKNQRTPNKTGSGSLSMGSKLVLCGSL